MRSLLLVLALSLLAERARLARRARHRAGNHAGQGVKAWVIAQNVPDDLIAMTLLDFAGALQTTEDGVLLVCSGPSAPSST